MGPKGRTAGPGNGLYTASVASQRHSRKKLTPNTWGTSPQTIAHGENRNLAHSSLQPRRAQFQEEQNNLEVWSNDD